MEGPEASAICDAVVAPGYRCGHRIEDHLVHGTALLECWQCEDWHPFYPRPLPRQRPTDEAA